MNEYASTDTAVLKETIAQTRTRRDELVDQKIDLENQLASVQRDLSMHRVALYEMEAELREREPELGGTYQHEEGFGYQSFRGRKLWEYRIIGTPVTIFEGPNQDGYVFYEPRCVEHGPIPFSHLEHERALSVGYRHFLEKHV